MEHPVEPPVAFTDYDTRLAAYAVIVDDDQRVLLSLWNEPDEPLWTMPGGGVDLGETPEQGAVREVREETGYDVRLDRLLGVDVRVVAPEDRRTENTRRPLKSVRVVYAATILAGTLTSEVGGSTDEARWWPLSDVAHLPQVTLVGASLDLWNAGRGCLEPPIGGVASVTNRV